jgi:hypothetical protein
MTPAAPPAAVGFDTRAAWVELLARLTDGFVRSIPRGGSPAAAVLPGSPSGDPVPAIEGFARMSVAWGAWLHEPSNPDRLTWDGRRHDVPALLARGLADATDPSGRSRWGSIADRDQRIVEAAEVATAVWLGGARLRASLDAIDPAAFGRVLDWVGLVDGRGLWPDNWVLFPVVSAIVRRALGGRRVDLRRVDEALDWMVAHAVGDGWTSDGPGHALDLYSGWAIHWHLLWWAAIDGDRRPALRTVVRRRARAWLRFVAALVADDGAFPRFGRSLGYRFAIAAPFAQAALLDNDPLPPGVARTRAAALVTHALAEGAIDPATDWFRIGVGGERPEVVEGYMSTGASAWAAHAFVGLALPASHPFWAVPAPGPGSWSPPGLVAAAAAGLLAARSPGATTLHNARSGHPADIEDHDYGATYGKLAYRSAFPIDVPVVSGTSAGSDDALVAIAPEAVGGADGADPARLAHRNESIAGSAGPGWITTRYRLPTEPPATVRTVVLVLGRVEVRVHGVRPGPGLRLRLRDGGATLGAAAGTPIELRSDDIGASICVSDGGRRVAIRALAGFDRIGATDSGPGRRNLVHDRSVHPYVEETVGSSQRRIVASATIAAVGDVDDAELLRCVEVDSVEDGIVRVRSFGPERQEALVDLGSRRLDVVELAGSIVRGRGLRVVVAAADGHALAGERIDTIDGVLTLARPGIVAVSRDEAGVEATVGAGLRLDPAWAGDGLDRLRVRDGAGPFGPPIPLGEAGVAPDRIVRSFARAAGSRLVTLRFERR